MKNLIYILPVILLLALTLGCNKKGDNEIHEEASGIVIIESGSYSNRVGSVDISKNYHNSDNYDMSCILNPNTESDGANESLAIFNIDMNSRAKQKVYTSIIHSDSLKAAVCRAFFNFSYGDYSDGSYEVDEQAGNYIQITEFDPTTLSTKGNFNIRLYRTYQSNTSNRPDSIILQNCKIKINE